jgi:hypothetical protein
MSNFFPELWKKGCTDECPNLSRIRVYTHNYAWPYAEVIADPAAAYLAPLARLPKQIETIVSQDEAELRTHAPRADAILYAFHRGNLLESILPLAHRVRWIQRSGLC